MKKYLAKKVPAFTLLEMAVVLFIISLLVLIILPNVAAQRKNASKINRNALQTELNTQAQLYMNDHNVNSVTVADLEQAKYLTASQVEAIKREHLEISHEKLTLWGLFFGRNARRVGDNSSINTFGVSAGAPDVAKYAGTNILAPLRYGVGSNCPIHDC